MFRFPWGDFHSLNLGWFLQKFNELRLDWATAEAGIDGALDAEIQKAEDALTDVFAARDAAAASASAANSSAQNASSSALNASQSSIASMNARDAARQAATNAAASETAAGNSATAASNSAGAAATSATQAGQSATAAGNSATAAGQSATNAAASETAAAGSATAAATSEANAAASEAAARTVEESIPAEYTDLSNAVFADATLFTKDYFKYDYADLEDLGSPGAANVRHAWLHKNRFGQVGSTGTGTTFMSYLINNPTKYLGGSNSNIINRLTREDFAPLVLIDSYALWLDFDYAGRGLLDNARGSGNIVVCTYNDETDEISLAELAGSFSVTHVVDDYKHISGKICVSAALPELYHNQNIAIIYQTKFPSIEEEWVISLRIEWTGWRTNQSIGDWNKSISNISPSPIATKNYGINDFVTIGPNLYRITSPIATGETITPGTNAEYTTIGDQLTFLLNQ